MVTSRLLWRSWAPRGFAVVGRAARVASAVGVLLVVVAMAGPARAGVVQPGTSTWDGGGINSAEWADPNNWLSNVAPASTADTALVFAGTSRLDAQQNLGNPFVLNSITFDATAGVFAIAGQPIDYRVNAALVGPTITQNSAAGSSIGTASVLTGTLTFGGSGAGGVTMGGQNLGLSGAGGLTMDGGYTLTLAGNASYTGVTRVNAGKVIANGQVLNSKVIVSGGGELVVNNKLDVGTGAFLQLTGTTAKVARVTLGASADVYSTETDVGDGAGANAEFNHNGGAHTVAGSLYIGVNTGGAGVYTMGQNTTLRTNRTVVGNSGTGVFNQNGGTHTAVAGVTLAANLSSTVSGTYNLKGGTLITPNVRRGLTAVPSAFNFLGGTLRASADNADFLRVNTVTINGGLKIDTDGHDVTITRGVPRNDAVNDGGLRKTGLGTLTLSGDVSSNAVGEGSASSYISQGGLTIPAGGAFRFIHRPATIGNGQFDIIPQFQMADGTTLNVTGGTFDAPEVVFEIGAGGPGVPGSPKVVTVNLSGGGTLSAGQTVMGNSMGMAAAFNQSGGTHAAGQLSVGQAEQTSAVYTLSGGTIATPDTTVGDRGTGTFNQTGGTHTVSGTLYLARASAGVGTYNLAGGTLAVNAVRGGAPGTFNFDGGTITPRAATADFITAAGGLNVRDGGAVFDTNGVDATITQALRHSPLGKLTGVTITSGGAGYYGAPIVTVTGGGGYGASAAATYNAATGVINGATISGGTNYTSAPTLSFNGGPGAQGAAAAVTWAADNAIDGGLTKNGAGVLTLAGTNTYTGATTVNAGTLRLGTGGTLGATTAALIVNANTTLDLGGVSPTVGSLAGSGTILNSATATASTLTVGGPSGTFTGTLTDHTGSTGGTLGLAKVGFGTLILAGPASYSGPTITAGGALEVAAGGSIANSRVDVRPGGTFSVDGGTVDAGSAVYVQVGTTAGAAVASMFLSGGSVTAGETDVGNVNGAWGAIIQSGGAHTVAGGLYLGVGAGSKGGYDLGGGAAVKLTVANLFVGHHGAGTFDQSGGAVSTSTAYVGNRSGSTGAATLSGGTFTTNNAALYLGYVAGSTGSYTMGETGQLSTGTAYVGSEGAGTFTQLGGTFTTNGANLYVGFAGAGSGSYALSGTGALTAGVTSVGEGGTGSMSLTGGTFTTNTKDLYLGKTTGATGTLTVGGTAQASVGSAVIGYDGTGSVTQSNGTLTTNGRALILGFSPGGAGTYALSGGTLTTGGTYVGLAGTGSFTQTGGTHDTTSGALYVGRATGSGGSNAYTLGGGTLTTLSDVIGINGGGTLTQSGGTHATGQIVLASGSAGNGTYNLDGGTLTALSVSRQGTSGVFNFNGGTLRPSFSTTAFFNGLTAANVRAGGAKVDTNGFDVTIAQTLAHDAALGGKLDGGLTKTGAGTLTLNAAGTYTGPTAVNIGRLRVTASIATSSGVSVADGATFDAGVGQAVKSIAVADGGNVEVTSTARSTLVTQALSLAGQRSNVDLRQNGLVIDYAGGSPLASVRDLIVRARHGGAWDGRGIGSSALTAATSMAIGYGEASAVVGPSGGTFLGTPVDSDAVLMRYTLAGDATLDGQVNFDDLVKLAQNYNVTDGSRTWSAGDFTYDGKVDFDDLVKLAQNYNTTLPGGAAIPGAAAEFGAGFAAAMAAVPEPSALAWVAAALGCARLRRPSRRRGLAAR